MGVPCIVVEGVASLEAVKGEEVHMVPDESHQKLVSDGIPAMHGSRVKLWIVLLYTLSTLNTLPAKCHGVGQPI